MASIVVAGVVTACAGPQAPRYPSPVTLEYDLRELPGPGLCRIVGQPPRSCEGIAYVAPTGSQVLYRLHTESSQVAICYMHRARPGVVYGVDLFDVYRRWLVDVLLSADDEPVPGDCDAVVESIMTIG